MARTFFSALILAALGNAGPVQADSSLISDNSGWRVFSETVPGTDLKRCLMVRFGESAAIVAVSGRQGESFFLIKRDDAPEAMELRFGNGKRLAIRDQMVQFESLQDESDFFDILIAGGRDEFRLVDSDDQKMLDYWSLVGSDLAIIDWADCINRIDLNQ